MTSAPDDRLRDPAVRAVRAGPAGRHRPPPLRPQCGGRLMHRELTRMAAELRTEDDARAIVLTAAGTTFSAGGDLGWFPHLRSVEAPGSPPARRADAGARLPRYSLPGRSQPCPGRPSASAPPWRCCATAWSWPTGPRSPIRTSRSVWSQVTEGLRCGRWRWVRPAPSSTSSPAPPSTPMPHWPWGWPPTWCLARRLDDTAMAYADAWRPSRPWPFATRSWRSTSWCARRSSARSTRRPATSC